MLGPPSSLGVIAGSRAIAIAEDIKAFSRGSRKDERFEKGFGQRKSDWHRRALSAYTWLRTERDPQKAGYIAADTPSSPASTSPLSAQTSGIQNASF